MWGGRKDLFFNSAYCVLLSVRLTFVLLADVPDDDGALVVGLGVPVVVDLGEGRASRVGHYLAAKLAA